MPEIIHLNTNRSEKGDLTVFEKILPGDIKRVFYITNVGEMERGGHSHKKSYSALVCLNGSCEIFVDNGIEEKNFVLDTNQKCLVLEPSDWRVMKKFSADAILLVASNQYFDEADYVDAKPIKQNVALS